MTTLRRLTFGFALAVSCFAAAHARAGLIIDSFTNTADGDPDVATRTDVGSDSEDFTISPTVTDPVGSRRRQFVQENVAATTQTTSLTVDGGTATIASSAGSVGNWSIVYGVGIFMDVNATAGGADSFKLTFDSFSGAMQVAISASSSGGGGTSNGGFYQNLSNTMLFPFSAFSGAPDFTDLTQITILLRELGNGGTAVLTEIATVPEPATGTLLAVASLAAVGAMLRQRRRLAAG